LGILGALGSTFTFVGTVTIIPFMPNGWDRAAGFPAMAGNVPFLMKDVVLLGCFDLPAEAGSCSRVCFCKARSSNGYAARVVIGAQLLHDSLCSPGNSARKTMSQPEQFDILVLGSGKSGKLLAWHMAQSGRRTAVIERRWIGGSCPNIACLPSKNEIWSARVAHLAHNAAQFGTGARCCCH
jgi:hypothetical protein